MAQAPDGANARHYLQRRLRLGSRVILRPQTADRYGRTVAEGIREINLGLAMGKDGMAFAYRKNLVLSNLKTSHSRTFHALNLETYGKRCLGALYFRYIHRSKL